MRTTDRTSDYAIQLSNGQLLRDSRQESHTSSPLVSISIPGSLDLSPERTESNSGESNRSGRCTGELNQKCRDTLENPDWEHKTELNLKTKGIHKQRRRTRADEKGHSETKRHPGLLEMSVSPQMDIRFVFLRKQPGSLPHCTLHSYPYSIRIML